MAFMTSGENQQLYLPQPAALRVTVYIHQYSPPLWGYYNLDYSTVEKITCAYFFKAVIILSPERLETYHHQCIPEQCHAASFVRGVLQSPQATKFP